MLWLIIPGLDNNLRAGLRTVRGSRRMIDNGKPTHKTRGTE